MTTISDRATATSGRTLDSIRDRWRKASAGPWHWSGNTKTHQIYLSRWVKGMGRVTVMAFSRWGMQGAQPQFIDNPADPFFVKDAADLPVYEVAPDARSGKDPKVYRHDLAGIRHPDAEAIANAPADVAWLVAEVERLQTQLDRVTLRFMGAPAEHDHSGPDWRCEACKPLAEVLRTRMSWASIHWGTLHDDAYPSLARAIHEAGYVGPAPVAAEVTAR